MQPALNFELRPPFLLCKQLILKYLFSRSTRRMKKTRTRRPSLKHKRTWMRLAKESRFNAIRMAKLCRITPRQLERHAQTTLGCTPQQWLDEQRMVAAQWLLREADTIKDVAFELGYSQASHFCRQFKQHYEITPSQFLKLHERLDRH